MMQNELEEMIDWIDRNGGILSAADGWYAFQFALSELETLTLIHRMKR